MADVEDLITWTDASGGKHFLNADAVISFDHDMIAEVTENAVEKGADVSDHIRVKPFTVKITIGHSPTPVFPEDGFRETDKTIEYQGLPNALGRLLGNTAAGAAVGGLTGAAPAPLGGAAAAATAFGASAALGALGLDGRPTETATVHVLAATSPKDRVNELVEALQGIVQNGSLISIAQRGRRFADYAVTRVGLSYGVSDLAKITIEAKTLRTVTTATAILPDPATLRAKPNKQKAANTKDANTGPGSSLLVKAGKFLGALE